MPDAAIVAKAQGQGQWPLCLLAGANSIFVGNRLLTTNNPEKSQDEALIAKLGMESETVDATIR